MAKRFEDTCYTESDDCAGGVRWVDGGDDYDVFACEKHATEYEAAVWPSA